MDLQSIENQILLTHNKEFEDQLRGNDNTHEDLKFVYQVIWKEGEDKAVLNVSVTKVFEIPENKTIYYDDLAFYKNGIETYRFKIDYKE